MFRQLISRSFSSSMTTNTINNNNNSNNNGLIGKVCAITASTDGIGLAIARRLARDGANVVISSRKEKNVLKSLNQLKLEFNSNQIEGVVCHVSKPNDRKALLQCALDKFGGLDVLVSNAAVNPAMGHFLDTTEEEFEKIFEINVKSAFMLTKEAVPLIRPGGSIVYVSSIGGYQPFPLISAYSVSKTALLGLSRAVALQCAPNIRCNVVCPGIIRTRFSQPLWESKEGLEEISRLTPLGRVGEPEEVANLVKFLVSSEASYITGESFVVAGGHYSRL